MPTQHSDQHSDQRIDQRIDPNEIRTRLRQAGEDPPRELFDDILAYGQAAVPTLIALATDDMLYLLDDDVPDIWAPYHAIRLLGELRAEEAVAPLMTLIAQDDDYIDQILPESLGRIGRPALEPLRVALFGPDLDLYGTARVGNALAEVAERHPELRSDVIGSLTARVERDDPSEDAVTLRAFLASDLAHLRAVEAAPSVRRAYQEDLIDESVIDLETFEVLVNRPEGQSAGEALDPLIRRATATLSAGPGRGARATGDWPSAAGRVAGASAPSPTSAPSPAGQPRYVGPKVGRNAPCPCGSGVKYKKCCGR